MIRCTLYMCALVIYWICRRVISVSVLLWIRLVPKCSTSYHSWENILFCITSCGNIQWWCFAYNEHWALCTGNTQDYSNSKILGLCAAFSKFELANYHWSLIKLLLTKNYRWVRCDLSFTSLEKIDEKVKDWSKTFVNNFCSTNFYDLCHYVALWTGQTLENVYVCLAILP